MPAHSLASAYRIVLLLAFVSAPAAGQGVDDAPPIRSVDVMPRIGMPGTELRVVVRIDPCQDDRALELTVDGLTYFARTDRQLDGADAPRTYTFTWMSLPTGDYTITTTLRRTGGHDVLAVRSMQVVGANDEIARDKGRP
jgi:hypothetical protein